jgi:hypothetical protein
MTAPTRIQLRLTKGWRMPPNTVKVDRSTRWGNPFKVGDKYLIGFTPHRRRQTDIIRSTAMAVELFRAAIVLKRWGWLDFDPAELANRPLGSVE